MSVRAGPLLLTVFAVVACSDGGLERDPTTSLASGDASKITFQVFSENENDPDPAVLSSGDSEIYAMNPDGSGITRLTDNFVADYGALWSPDGKLIASTRDEPDGGLYSIKADGSGETRLVAVDLTNCPMTLDWSPDSKQIVFSSCGDRSSADLYVINADGTGRARLTHDNLIGFEPDWSPNGTEIAFVCVGPPSGICTMNSDGRSVQRLTDHAGDSAPDWSPDGKKIAFFRWPNGGVYVMNPDGSEPTRLVPDARNSLVPELAWSPNAKRIAYVDEGEIYVVGLDRTAPMRLSERGAMDSEPSWSPDGTKLAFTNQRDNEVYVMNADGSGRKRLTRTDGNASNPVWSP